MDINLNDLIYAYFVLHNYCEASKETMEEHSVMSTRQHDQKLQPSTVTVRELLKYAASSIRFASSIFARFCCSPLQVKFTVDKEDPSRDSVKKQIYSGLAMHISLHVFVNNLGIMCDALQELSKLSVKLQKRDITIIQHKRQFVEKSGYLRPCWIVQGATLN